MQLKYKETLGRGREREEQACSPRLHATREGQAASRSGSGLGRAADGSVEVGVGGGVEYGVWGGVEAGE